MNEEERAEVLEAAKRRRDERIANPPKQKKAASSDAPATWDDWFKGS